MTWRWIGTVRTYGTWTRCVAPFGTAVTWRCGRRDARLHPACATPRSMTADVQAVWDAMLDGAVAGARNLPLEEFATASCADGAVRDVKTEYAGVEDYPRVANVSEAGGRAAAATPLPPVYARHAAPSQ